ncbi:glycosyltransferase family 2 protein [Pseudoalteromonas sp. G4]|uniref:glycosyltransferase family 2 protein n=1 Tax=Pseudoalteromonas sp. G4 TaxID=2992761 RepID=UPI00237E025E|nr:glycosyltransferase family A protein [Pseudoalteromonas sp. G4]MDE3270652.1 glycosyltransferase family 2 protein [Pseudoalteromonas sp. G4]
MMNNPISVVIPLYNKEAYIRRAIESVICQTYPATEIIVVDDGSTDSSAMIIESEYPSVKLFKQKNAGVSAARNKGLSIATSSLVAFLDADDEFCTQHLHHLNNLYCKFPNYALFGNSYLQLSEHLIESQQIDYSVRNYVSEYPRNGGLIHSSTALIDKSKLDNLTIFPEGVKMGEDVYAWVKLCSLANGKVPVCSYVGAIYHDDTIGAMNSGQSKPYPEVLKAQSPLHTLDTEITAGFKKHFHEDYVRSVYKYGTRVELLRALLRVRKLYVIKFSLKFFLPISIIERFK